MPECWAPCQIARASAVVRREQRTRGQVLPEVFSFASRMSHGSVFLVDRKDMNPVWGLNRSQNMIIARSPMSILNMAPTIQTIDCSLHRNFQKPRRPNIDPK